MGNRRAGKREGAPGLRGSGRGSRRLRLPERFSRKSCGGTNAIARLDLTKNARLILDLAYQGEETRLQLVVTFFSTSLRCLPGGYLDRRLPPYIADNPFYFSNLQVTRVSASGSLIASFLLTPLVTLMAIACLATSGQVRPSGGSEAETELKAQNHAF